MLLMLLNKLCEQDSPQIEDNLLSGREIMISLSIMCKQTMIRVQITIQDGLSS